MKRAPKARVVTAEIWRFGNATFIEYIFFLGGGGGGKSPLVLPLAKALLFVVFVGKTIRN